MFCQDACGEGLSAPVRDKGTTKATRAQQQPS